MGVAVGIWMFVISQGMGSLIAYWRFEDDANIGQDSSGNARTLSEAGAPEALSFPADVTSDFPNPIPQTGASNAGLISITSSTPGNLYRADEPAFYLTSFTIETMARPEDVIGFRTLVTQTGADSDRQWRLIFNPANGRFRLSLSSDGSTWVDFSTDLPVYTAGDDLYLAASVSVDSTAGTSGTLYHQNFTTGGSLLAVPFASASLTSLYNSSAALSIGGRDTSAGTNPWRGRVDEVRLSGSELSVNELLVVPEPGTALLTLFGLAAVAAARRRLCSWG